MQSGCIKPTGGGVTLRPVSQNVSFESDRPSVGEDESWPAADAND
jgi:hypothetical protein